METEGAFVSISTLPTKSPFYVGQTVQFTCETTSTRNISYQWNYNDHGHSNTRTGQIINVTFDQSVIRYIWVLCTASSSGITLGKANKMIEVNGKLHSVLSITTTYYLLSNILGWLQFISPQSQTFATNQTVTMNISVSDTNHELFFITSLGLAWYHNGTRIEANDRIDISNNKTTLTISNTKDSDAGKYQVRIDSLTFGNHNYPECDQWLLPILENYALHTPATFLLQQNVLPNYNPEDIINIFSIPLHMGGNQLSFTVNVNVTFNSTIYQHATHYWSGYKDGQYCRSLSFRYYATNNNLLLFTYNISYQNSQSILGHYTLLHFTHYYNFMEFMCHDYFRNLMYHFRYILFRIHYWTFTERKCKVFTKLQNHISTCALLLQLLSLPPPNQCLCG